MPDQQGQGRGAPGEDPGQNTGSSTSHAGSGRDYWRDCEPHYYCGPSPPYWDPCCGPPPHYGRHHHHGRHHRWPMPGSEFFEAMMQFAASAAGSRERWWEGMAEAARHARRDYMCGDPCYDPCAPRPSYCDPCCPPPSYCDPCAPPRSYCDPCAPQYARHGPSEESDLIDIKGLSEALKASAEKKLQHLSDEADKAEGVAKAEKAKEYVNAKAKAEAANDAIIHAVKLARVADAMRRKQWSRGSRSGRRY